MTTPRLACAARVFREQITALVEGGVDLIILETFSNLVELRQAVLAAREVRRSAPDRANDLRRGWADAPGQHARSGGAGAGQAGRGRDRHQLQHRTGRHADASREMTTTIRKIAPDSRTTNDLVSAQPNAGLPARVENRFLYGSTPGYFAEYARRFAEAGVAIHRRLLRHHTGSYRRHARCPGQVSATTIALRTAPAGRRDPERQSWNAHLAASGRRRTPPTRARRPARRAGSRTVRRQRRA